MRILIVGGGIAGLAMARALALRGMEAEIVERDAGWRIAGAGVYLPGNGMAALARLGLDEEVRSHGDVVARRRLMDHRGRLLIDFDEAGFWGAVGQPTGLHRRDLHEVLARAVSPTGVRFSCTVGSVVDLGDAASVGLSDGTTARYELVIGADGVHSALRTRTLGGPAARLAGQVGWRWVVDGHPEITGWNGWLGSDRAFLALGIGGGRVYCYADIRATQPADPTAGDATRIGPWFASFADPVPALVAAMPPGDVVFSPIEEAVPPTWGSGRIVLVGDAAHASSPNMAEGASLAIEDALVLAELLAAGGPLDDVLHAFRARRTPRVAWVQDKTHARDRLRYLRPRVRNVVMRAAGQRTFRAHYGPLLAPP